MGEELFSRQCSASETCSHGRRGQGKTEPEKQISFALWPGADFHQRGLTRVWLTQEQQLILCSYSRALYAQKYILYALYIHVHVSFKAQLPGDLDANFQGCWGRWHKPSKTPAPDWRRARAQWPPQGLIYSRSQVRDADAGHGHACVLVGTPQSPFQGHLPQPTLNGPRPSLFPSWAGLAQTPIHLSPTHLRPKRIQ